MKKYVVLRKIGIFNADAVRSFDDQKDAYDYANLMSKSETSDRTKYSVAEILEELS